MFKKDYNIFLISKEDRIRDGMKKLDETAEKILYIVNQDKCLIGSLSDGDIRRALLKGISIDAKIELAMNNNPKFIYHSDKNYEEIAKKLMVEFQVESIPLVDQEKRFKGVIYWIEVFGKDENVKYEKKKNKVFILAGGIGSRLEPFTKILPKPLVPFGDKPIVENIMDRFCKYGFDKFILSIYYKAEMIKLYFSDADVKNKYSEIDYVHETTPLGTIGSLYLSKAAFDDSFFISNSDILIEEDMEKVMQFHKENQAILTVIGCMKNSVIPYGVLNTNGQGGLMNIDEKPEYKHIINTGVYVAEPEIIKYITPNQKTDITELINSLLEEGKTVSIYPIVEEHWFDIGQWAEYRKSIEILNGKQSTF